MTTLYPGKTAYMGIALQGASSTPVTPRKYLSVKDIDFETQAHHTYVTEYRNRMESSRAPIRDGIETTGTLSSSAYPDSLIYLLWGAMGTAVTTTPATSNPQVYSHALTVNQTDVPSWTIHEGLDSLNFYSYPNAKIKTLKLSLKQDEPFTLDADFVAQGVSRIYTATTPSYATSRSFTFLDALAYIDAATSTLIQELDLTINRDTEAIKTMNGSMDATYIYPQDMKASGSLTMMFDGETEYNRYMGLPSAASPSMQSSATPMALKVVLLGQAVTGTYLQAVTLVFPEVYYDKTTFKRATDKYVSIGFDFTAVYNESAGYSMTGVVQNGIASVTP